MADIDELVSVVVPARNEETAIRACLRSIQEQTYTNLQIIVIDGASDDRTAEKVKEIADTDHRVELIINPDRVIPVSLNLALEAARGHWLVRVDAHAAVPADYVGRAVAHLRSGRWGGVGGRKDGVGVTAAGRAVALAMSSRFGVGGSTYHHGTTVRAVEHVPFGAYPVELARSLGGWDENLRVNQDFEFDYRVRESGAQLLFDPRLVIHWQCRQSIPDLFRQYRRYGTGKVRVAWKHPRSLRVRHLTAPALIANIAVAAAVAPARPRWAAALLVPYAVALSCATAATIRRADDRATRAWVAPAFASMHLGWGVGFWFGVVGLAKEYARRRPSGRQR